MKGKRLCQTHGDCSTRPRTEEGRQRRAKAKTKTCTETRKVRTQRAEAMRRLKVLEDLGHSLGVYERFPRSRS